MKIDTNTGKAILWDADTYPNVVKSFETKSVRAAVKAAVLALESGAPISTSHDEIVAARLKKIVAESLGISTNDVSNTSTMDELGADSLDVVETVMMAEDEFNVEISDDEALTVKTFADMVELIKKKL